MQAQAHDRILVAILAAGKSRRFGSDKRLFPVNGTPMLQQTLSLPLSLGMETLLVLKPQDELILEQLLGPWQGNHRLKLNYCVRFEQGMGCTLASAADYALRRRYRALVVMLGDMPFLSPATLQQMVNSWQPEQILVPRFEGRWGHPVVFGQRWLAELARLRGDRGGRALLSRYADQVSFVDVADEGVLRDLDQPPGQAPLAGA